ncbi:hypothetical protein DQ04_04591010 [Trypanosoma grayi]|uniref:hypothetical protein n=1 Tax=Trypanosoma grayi TaxID=71804 RepID=UPI0004F4661D|nr:hypothetical protein DQ04_04591010 [Trypanosoma grayi]KEG09812.1 hypothetical protein DQ04_04591010 [Trypanosoma grayi]
MRRAWLARCAASTSAPGASSSSPSASEMQRRIRAADITLRVATKDGTARVVYASTSGLLRETLRRHNLAARTHGHRPFLQLLGTHLSLTNMLAALQEGEERVASRFTAEEATIVVEALALGECRCYVRGDCNATIEGPPFPFSVGRTLYGQSQPFWSTTAAQLGQFLTEEEEEETNEGNSVPIALGLADVPREELLANFHYNISLHGYNFFRKSEGSASALWCCVHLDDPAIQKSLAEYTQQEHEQKDATSSSGGALDEKDNNLDMVLARAGVSYGILVQPLVATRAVEVQVHQLQRALLRASIANPAVFRELSRRAVEECLSCQDTLSLVTGDYEGAYTVAMAARQFTQDPSTAAPVIEKLRQQLGVNDFRLSLDCDTPKRNRLDYLCRCSKDSFLQSMSVLPADELARFMHETSFRCVFCGKERRLHQEDWQKVLQKRGG